MLGKVLGGSSVINAMIYVRGNKIDYDNWVYLGNVGWSFDEVLPYFKKSEKLEDDEVLKDDTAREYHGTDGYLPVNKFRHRYPVVKAIIEAASEMGYKELIDHNSNHGEGYGEYHLSTKDGRRWNNAKAFLEPEKGRHNVHVTKNSHATKILIDPKTKTAYGVQFKKGDKLTEKEAELLDLKFEGCKSFKFNTRKYCECEVIFLSTTLYHPVGTCKMGPSRDLEAVVDLELTVYGVKQLRVVDALIMPDIVTGNIHAATIMIAEKASDLPANVHCKKDGRRQSVRNCHSDSSRSRGGLSATRLHKRKRVWSAEI
uniref:Glucose-methanol-choline oxidoreductase N-terminal domain-containing protein n=1 Tax=Timema shepardi TaxID=629360 RepID=A0A7R9AU62_TIMSH|nr:unnamed protein product [Timema shepardi]